MLRRFVFVLVGSACAFYLLPDAAIRPGLCRSRARCCTRAKPATGAVVYFHRQGEPGTQRELVPFGIVQDDGRFSLSSNDLGNGALPGSYAVLVEWRDGKASGVVPVKGKGQTNLVKRSRIHAGPDRLKRPLLRCEQAAVASGSQARSQPARAVRAKGLTGATID